MLISPDNNILQSTDSSDFVKHSILILTSQYSPLGISFELWPEFELYFHIWSIYHLIVP